MSELPKGWLGLTLSEVVDIQKGKKPFDLGEKNSTRQIPYINIAAFETGYIREYAVEQNIPKCEPKDTLLVWDGARAGLSGRGANGYIGSTLAKISSPYTDPDYLFYFFQSIYKILNTQTKGVGIPHIDPNILKNLKFPLPPINEQTRIVAKLEELFSDLDAGVSELKTAQVKLVQYRQSLLKAAVEGELSCEWRESRFADNSDETGEQLLERILIERRKRWEEKQLAKFAEQGKQPPKDWQKKYPEPIKPDTSRLPDLPDGWVWATVEQLGIVQLGRQRSPSKMHGISPVKYIRAANITELGVNLDDVLEMDFSDKEIETFKLKRGDILLTEASGSAEHVGRPAIWTKEDDVFCFQNTVIRFRSQGLNTDFAFYTFLAYQKLGKFRQVSGGVGINHLSAGKFSNIAIHLPSLNEQQAITSILEALLDQVKNQSVALEQSLKQYAAQRKNILRAAFAGELVPQDPNDEPASMLLARIQAERQAQISASKTSPPKTRKAASKKQPQLSLEG